MFYWAKVCRGFWTFLFSNRTREWHNNGWFQLYFSRMQDGDHVFVFLIIDHRNDVKVFKTTNHRPVFLLLMSLKIKANILNFISVRKNNKQYTCTEGKQVSAAKIHYVWIRNSYVVYLTSVSKQLGTRSQSCKIRYFCRSSITNRVVSLWYTLSGKTVKMSSDLYLCKRSEIVNSVVLKRQKSLQQNLFVQPFVIL